MKIHSTKKFSISLLIFLCAVTMASSPAVRFAQAQDSSYDPTNKGVDSSAPNQSTAGNPGNSSTQSVGGNPGNSPAQTSGGNPGNAPAQNVAGNPGNAPQPGLGGSSAGSNTGGGNTPAPAVFYIQNPLDQSKFSNIGDLINGFLSIFVYLVILFAVLMIIYVGFRMVMAQGNPKEIEDRKRELLYLVIGIAIVIGARIILSVVINTLAATGLANPNVIQSAHNALQQ